MRFGLIAYPKKPLLIAHRDLFGVFFNLHTLFMREAKALARSCVDAGWSEPSPHANVIRTIISCADQFSVVIFHCRPLFYFLIQYKHLNS